MNKIRKGTRVEFRTRENGKIVTKSGRYFGTDKYPECHVVEHEPVNGKKYTIVHSSEIVNA